MAAPCKACAHPQRQAIDEALAGGESHRGLARRYELSRDALMRHHKAHVSPALVKVVQERHAGTLVDRIEQVITDVEDVLQAAKTSGAGGLVLQSVDRLERLLRLLGQLTGELKDNNGPAVTINVLQSPEVLQVIRAVRHVLADQPERLEAFSAYLKLPQPVS